MTGIILILFMTSVVKAADYVGTLDLETSPTSSSPVNESVSVDFTCSLNASATPVFSIRTTSEEILKTLPQGQSTTAIVLLKKYNRQGIRCRADGDGGAYRVYSSPVTFTILFQATTVTLTPSHTGLIAENTVVTFTCVTDESNPISNIVWTRDGTRVSTGIITSEVSGRYSSKMRKSVLTVTTDRSLNGAMYTCHVEGKQSVSDSGELQVEFQAKDIELTPSHTGRIAEDTVVTFTCLTDEFNPVSNIVWTRDGNIVNGGITVSSDSGRYNSNKRRSVLTVTTDRSLNGAQYECYVNEEASVNDNILLLVEFQASTIELTPSHTGLIAENIEVTFTCVTDESNPISTIMWTRDGTRVTSGISVGEVDGMYNTNKRRSVLRVTTHRSLNGAQYKCYVEGTESVSNSTQLHVKFPHDVEIIQSPSDSVVEGSSLTLTCEATGGNPAEVSYNWSFVPRYEESSELSGETERELQFDSVEYTQAGVYTCEATNGGGVNSASKQVLVNFSPQDVSSDTQKEITTTTDSIAILNCTVRAYPIPTQTSVTVRFGDSYIPTENIGMLSLPVDETVIELGFDPVTSTDYGVYEVTVNNGVGSPTLIRMTLSEPDPDVSPTAEAQTSNALIGGIVGGIIAVVVIALVVFGLLYLRKRRIKKITKEVKMAPLVIDEKREDVDTVDKSPRYTISPNSTQQQLPEEESSYQNKTEDSTTAPPGMYIQLEVEGSAVPKQEIYENTTPAIHVASSNKQQDDGERPYQNVTVTPETDAPLEPEVPVYMNMSKSSQNLALEVNDSQEEKLICKGRYFSITKGKLTQHGEVKTVAVKILGDSKFPYLSNQVRCLEKIGKHSNIVEILDSSKQGQTATRLVMPFYSNGNLRDFLRSKASKPDWMSLKEKQDMLRNICISILQGLSFLEGQKDEILHFQLSLDNVLVDDSGNCRLTGFATKENVLLREMMEEEDGNYGAIQWKAPEVIEDCKAHTRSSDVWALGIVLYEVYTLGEYPYNGWTQDDIKAYVKEGNILDKPSDCPANIYDIMKTCWEYTPEKRPTFTKLLRKMETPQKPKPGISTKPANLSQPVKQSNKDENPYVNVKK